METKHTPGPWQVDIEGSFVSVDMDASKLICDIRGWGWLSKLGEEKAIAIQKANGRLISAAPELLETCAKALIHLEHLNIEKGLQEDLRQAIKKATL